MRFILSILLTIFVSFPAISLTIDDLVYRQGLLYEKFTNTPFTGEVGGRKQGKIINGSREGVWHIYRENGQLHFILNYKNNILNGETIEYTETGDIFMVGQYKDYFRVGEWIQYRKNTNSILKKWNYKNGELHGIYASYYKNGSAAHTVEYINGEKDGLEIKYLKNGNIEFVRIFENGKLIREQYE